MNRAALLLVGVALTMSISGCGGGERLIRIKGTLEGGKKYAKAVAEGEFVVNAFWKDKAGADMRTSANVNQENNEFEILGPLGKGVPADTDFTISVSGGPELWRTKLRKVKDSDEDVWVHGLTFRSTRDSVQEIVIDLEKKTLTAK